MQDPVKAFHEAVLRIEDGTLTKIAEKAGLTLHDILRYRRKPTDVRISNLARLADALGKSADELLGLKPPTATDVGSSPGLTSRDVARLRKRLAKMGAFAAEAQAMLPPEDGAQEPEE